MKNEIRLNLDQHLTDRLEALFLLHQERFPSRSIQREELLQKVLEKGLLSSLREFLQKPDERPVGRRNARERIAA